MVSPTLRNYVKTTLKQGYSSRSIRTRLIQSGYSAREADLAIREVSGKRVLNTKTLAIIAGIIIVLIVLVIIGLKIITPAPKQVSISTTPLVSTVLPGGKLTFVNTLVSSSSRKVAVTLTHTIINKQTGKQIASSTETKQVGKRSSTETQITIPSDAETGAYDVITQMEHAQGTGESRFSFVVERKTGPSLPEIEEPTEVSLICVEGCDDYNSCTQDICYKGTCEHNPITPCCGNGICESNEDQYNCPSDCKKRTGSTDDTIKDAIRKAKSDPIAATMLCNSLPYVTDADECFNQAATEANKFELCESIQETEIKDSCLVNFAIKGNYAVCDRMDDPYYIQSCYSLERQAGIQGMVSQFG